MLSKGAALCSEYSTEVSSAVFLEGSRTTLTTLEFVPSPKTVLASTGFFALLMDKMFAGVSKIFVLEEEELGIVVVVVAAVV